MGDPKTSMLIGEGHGELGVGDLLLGGCWRIGVCFVVTELGL